MLAADLAGEAEVEVSDGEVRRFGPGDLVLSTRALMDVSQLTAGVAAGEQDPQAGASKLAEFAISPKGQEFFAVVERVVRAGSMDPVFGTDPAKGAVVADLPLTDQLKLFTAILELSARSGLVVVTGGLGPTLDDVDDLRGVNRDTPLVVYGRHQSRAAVAATALRRRLLSMSPPKQIEQLLKQGLLASDAPNNMVELCRQVGDTPQRFSALWGLWVFAFTRAELPTARELGAQLCQLAQRLPAPALLEAHRALGQTLFFLGEMVAACAHVERGVALYDPQLHRPQAFLCGSINPQVVCLSYTAWALWVLGYPEQAVQLARKTIEGFAAIEPVTIPVALLWGGCALFRWSGDLAIAKECIDRLISEAERQLLIKTRSARVADVHARIRALHTYDLPELIVLPILDGSADYGEWVKSETR